MPSDSSDTEPMSSKKVGHGKPAAVSKGGYFVYHGIRIAEAGKPPSKIAKIIEKELLKRSGPGGKRKSA